MRTFLLLFALMVIAVNGQVKFDDYFEPKTLRIDYSHVGDADNEVFYIDGLRQEPYWGGPVDRLITPFNYGKYRVEVADKESGELIYARNFNTLFGEWQTIEEAKRVQKRFPEAVTVPYPKADVEISFHARNRKLEFIEQYRFTVDPSDYNISAEMAAPFEAVTLGNAGSPADNLDIVFVPEGYTAEEMEKFVEDAERFAENLTDTAPFDAVEDQINFYAVLAPSADSGPDIPGDDVWKRTVVNSRFYTFNIERYLMTEDYQAVCDVAANAPYDQIVVLVNTDKYGGGGIYNFYSLVVSDNTASRDIFIHEFGHGFAFLADEYYTSEVAYEDYYDLTIEPLEPNITTLVDFETKWADLVEEDTPIPTPDNGEFEDAVGAFEGGGYLEKGIYRPVYESIMKSYVNKTFGPVNERAINEILHFYITIKKEGDSSL